MKKRLRKKLHRGEFQELGFTVSWQFTDALDAEGLDTFFTTLVAMVEGKELTFGGGETRSKAQAFFTKRDVALFRKKTARE